MSSIVWMSPPISDLDASQGVSRETFQGRKKGYHVMISDTGVGRACSESGVTLSAEILPTKPQPHKSRQNLCATPDPNDKLATIALVSYQIIR